MKGLALIVILGIIIAVYAIWYKPELVNKIQEAQKQNPDLTPLQAAQQQAIAKAEEVKQAIIEKMEARQSNSSVSAPVMNILPQSFAAQPSAAMTMTIEPTRAAVVNTSPMQSVLPAKTVEAISATPSRPVVPIVSVPIVRTGSAGTGTSRVFVERKYT